MALWHVRATVVTMETQYITFVLLLTYM